MANTMEAHNELEPEALPGADDLIEALLALRTPDELSRFLRDLCTRSELEALAHRWEIVQLLDDGLPYLDVAEKAQASTATVTRVAQWLRHGTGGYQTALDRTKRKRKK
jgi:TrpR-related protein YerC/YecD